MSRYIIGFRFLDTDPSSRYTVVMETAQLIL